MSNINQQISFLLWFDIEQQVWAKMNWIQYFQIPLVRTSKILPPQSPPPSILKERAGAFFCRKTDHKFLKWEFLVCISSAKGLGHWWGQILSESLAGNTNMLSLSQEETPAARATHYLSRVWEGCDRCDGEDGFAPQTNRYCSWVHQGIGPSTGFAFLSQNDLDHFHLEHIFHKSNQDQYPPSICKSSNCIK